MEKDNSKAYSEVIEILKLIDDEKLLEALPMEMLEVLKSKADPEYKPQISSEILLEEQNLQPETLHILSWIAMKYWNVEGENKEDFGLNIKDNKEEQLNKKDDVDIQLEDKQDKENVKQESLNKQDIQQEENKTQIEKEEKVNSLKSEQSKIREINTTLPIAHNQLKWYEKIRIKIIEFINKLFRRNK